MPSHKLTHTHNKNRTKRRCHLLFGSTCDNVRHEGTSTNAAATLRHGHSTRRTTQQRNTHQLYGLPTVCTTRVAIAAECVIDSALSLALGSGSAVVCCALIIAVTLPRGSCRWCTDYAKPLAGIIVPLLQFEQIVTRQAMETTQNVSLNQIGYEGYMV